MTRPQFGASKMPKKTRLIPARRATFTEICRVLKLLRGRIAEHELAVVRIPFAVIAWGTFPAPSCDLPGADVGQVADSRFALANQESLHLQRFITSSEDVIEAHLDDHDACVAPIQHAADATRAIEYGI